MTHHDTDNAVPTSTDSPRPHRDERQVPDDATVARRKVVAIRRHRHGNELEEARNTRREPNPLKL